MYDIQQYRKVERKRRSPLVRAIRFILISALIVFTIFVFVHKEKDNKSTGEAFFISPLGEVVQKTVVYFNSKENSKNLGVIVSNILKKDTSNYSVFIDNLKTGERYYLNEDKEYETASLYKLWVMATTFKAIKAGTISEDTVLTEDIEILNDKFNIATESAELTEGQLSLPVSSLLSRMIMISDNYSALLLTEKLRLSSVASFLNEYGFSKSKVGTVTDNPISTTSDIGLFLTKLYNGEIIDTEYSTKMIDLLKKQQLNGKLPKLLSEDVVIAHKTGELGRLSHDGGIVFSKKGDYVIVIMSDTSSPLVANSKIAEISKEVYDYFNM